MNLNEAKLSVYVTHSGNQFQDQKAFLIKQH